MFAIVKTSGRQYRVEPGKKIFVDRRKEEAGSEVTLEDVLLIADGENVKIGAPVVSGAKVKAKVVTHGKFPKVIAYKYLRRKNAHKKIGHRHQFTLLEITEIQG